MKENLLICLMIMMSISFSSCNNKSKPYPEYEGEDISTMAEILRDKDTKKASLRIETDDSWKVYAGKEVKSIDFSKPVLEGEGSGTFPLKVSISERSYFQLITDKGKAILAERHLPMTGGFNFRDLGGYKNKEGRYIKWGKIFRSDDLHNLTDKDLEYLSSIPIVSVVDFRSQEEMKQAPDRTPSSMIKEYIYSITPGNLSASTDFTYLLSLNMDSVMMSINEMLVTDSAAIKQYKDFFALLQNEKDVPLMFHCSAGKDRTGMGAALILLALDVEEKVIMDDYLLSNKYLADKYAKYVELYPQLQPLFGVKKEFLQAGLNKIKEKYGRVENYLEQILNVNIDHFREMYLY